MSIELFDGLVSTEVAELLDLVMVAMPDTAVNVSELAPGRVEVSIGGETYDLVVTVEGGQPRRLRSYYLDDAGIGRIVAGTARNATEPTDGTRRNEPTVDPRNHAERSGTGPVAHDVRLDGHPAWRTLGGYAVSLHRHLRDTTDTAAGAARAVGCSDRHARACLAAMALAGLTQRVGTQWEALPASLDVLDSLDAEAVPA